MYTAIIVDYFPNPITAYHIHAKTKDAKSAQKFGQ